MPRKDIKKRSDQENDCHSLETGISNKRLVESSDHQIMSGGNWVTNKIRTGLYFINPVLLAQRFPSWGICNSQYLYIV